MLKYIARGVIVLLLVPIVASGRCQSDSQSQMQEQCICIKNDLCNNTFVNEPIQLNYTVKSHVIDISLINFDVCENTTYKAQLVIYESINSSDKCTRNTTSKLHGKYHSHLKLTNKCISCYENKSPTVSFNYVFSGCYLFEIYKRNTRVAHSITTFITTQYKKTIISGFEIRNSSRQALQNKTVVELIMASREITKPPSIYTNLYEINFSNLSNRITIASETKITSELNEVFIQCDGSSNISYSCNYTKDVNNYFTYWCSYWNLHPGIYHFKYKLLDEFTRCNHDSIWNTNKNNTCTRYFRFEVPRAQTIKSNHEVHTKNPFYTYVAITSCVLMLSLLITAGCLYKKFCSNRSEDRNIEEAQTMISLHIAGPNQFENEILIIHARDMDLFAEMLNSLKHLLSSLRNTKVYDFSTCSQEAHFDEDWIRSKISNIDTKVILFLNQCAIILYENPKILYAQPKREDTFFIYAIKQLQATKTRNHSNFFVVGLANWYDNLTISLNPEARYLMSDNLIKLLRAIFSKDEQFDEDQIKEFNSKCQECILYYAEYSDYHKKIFKYT